MTIDERLEFLTQSIESHDRQLGELTDRLNMLANSFEVQGARVDARIAAQSANIDKIVEMSNRDAIDIAALARIAQSHERRLDRIEG